MIEINRIKDLEPYAEYIPAIKNNCDLAKVRFVFKDKKGCLKDVIFNCDLDLKRILYNDGRLEDLMDKEEYCEGFETEILAKNIVINKTLEASSVKCESLRLRGELKSKFTVVKNDIDGSKIDSNYIYAKSISCEEVKCIDLDAKYVYTTCLDVYQAHFFRVKFQMLSIKENEIAELFEETQDDFWNGDFWFLFFMSKILDKGFLKWYHKFDKGEAMANSGNKSLLIMYVLSILKEYTDEEHPLTQKEIKDKIYSIYGAECDRKTIAEKIDALIFVGYDIVKLSSGGCYLGSREFEPSEISFLIDAVFSSKSIDSKKSKDLAMKLSLFLSKQTRKKYNYIYKSDEISRTSNKQLFYTIDILHDAIEQKKQVEFLYDRAFVSKEKQEKQNKKRYVVSPYFLVNNQGKYYLVCNYDYFDDIANYRLEQIKDIKILETPAKPIEKVKGFEKGLDIAKYANENIYMFSSESVSATLKLYNEYVVSSVYDWFGSSARIYTKGDEIFADIKVNENALVYWCIQYGESVELVSPQKTRDKIKKQIENLMKKYK